MSFRKSWKFYDECVDLVKPLQVKHDHDHTGGEDLNQVEKRLVDHLASAAFWGSGLFHYLVDLVPRHFKWIIQGIGFKADRVLAIQEFNCSVAAQGMTSPLGSILLICILVFWEENTEQSNILYNSIASVYPDGVLFKYLGGYLLRFVGDVEKSTRCFDEASKRCDEEKLVQLFHYSKAEIGYNSYLNHRYEDAVPHLSFFIENTTVKGYKCFIMLILGITYEMLNRTGDSLCVLAGVGPIARKGYALDEFSERMAKKILHNGGMTAAEKVQTQAYSLFELKKFEEAAAILNNSHITLTDEELACRQHLLGSCYHKLQKYQEAIGLFNEVLAKEKKIKTEKHVLPFSYCSLGEIQLKLKNYDEAHKLLHKALSYSKYDFEAWLTARVKRALEKPRE
eukprot:TRINITY_DN13289_c0_g1_i1.p1 TRINITY_DN13289_c0_g1~~TRINITY_DN13289_c0_g1_i1.p1  ORF type:complete len:396 (+),score=76.19 TRINITY_DN13289_c0_g1_i1:369-1556(+)